ncbi:hypothetical protein [Kiloniella sp. b19]|uniref:hypothetical protein n=1 Tax=Kiloniella sp. GXU_MW_B19 TaxID=3141326 RepID=UPI0031DA78B0
MRTRLLQTSIISLMLLTGFSSLFLKARHEGGGVAPSLSRDISALTQYMSAHALAPLDSPRSLNREGSFQALFFKGQNCRGGWLISPMYRNSEAVTLFESQSLGYARAPGALFFVLNGQSYPEFPALELWFYQKADAFQKALGLKSGSLKPLYAVRSFGTCGRQPFEAS